MRKKLYFDSAATGLFDEVILRNAFEKSLEFYANPSSLHEEGKKAKEAIENARKKAANALKISPDNLYFTSGGTEANQITLLSLLTRPKKGRLLISAIEHAAVKEQAKMLSHCGWELDFVPVDKNGFVKLDVLKEKLTNDLAMLSIMAVNNETGAIQPIKEIAALLQEQYGEKAKPKFHVDAVQAIGKIPFSLDSSGIDLASISAHKIGGPQGIGAIYSKKPIESFLKGGNQEKGLRSGTENLFGILGFADVLEKYVINSNNKSYERYWEQKKLMEFFLIEIEKIKASYIIPNTRKEMFEEKFSPWIVQIAFENLPAQVLIRALSDKGIFISSGSACSSKKLDRPVLEAMHISKEIMQNAVRFSFSPNHTKSDIEVLLETLKEIVSLYI